MTNAIKVLFDSKMCEKGDNSKEQRPLVVKERVDGWLLERVFIVKKRIDEEYSAVSTNMPFVRKKG